MLANSGDPDQTPHSATSDLNLQLFANVSKKDAMLIWVQLIFRVSACFFIQSYI